MVLFIIFSVNYFYLNNYLFYKEYFIIILFVAVVLLVAIVLFSYILAVRKSEKYTVKTIVYGLFNIKYVLRTKNYIENDVFDN